MFCLLSLFGECLLLGNPLLGKQLLQVKLGFSLLTLRRLRGRSYLGKETILAGEGGERFELHEILARHGISPRESSTSNYCGMTSPYSRSRDLVKQLLLGLLDYACSIPAAHTIYTHA